MTDSSAATPTLALDDIRCERDDRVLFAGLSAQWHAGAVVQVLGENGAGKTTLLRIICGLAGGWSGSVQWQGGPNRGYDFYASLLYLGHQPGVKNALTARENLLWYFGLNGTKQRGGNPVISAEQVDTALAAVGLAGYEEVFCSNMSAGQKRRVALARLHLSSAPLWLLDEPFTAIDRDGVSQLESLFARHAANGGTIVLTSHQPLALPGVEYLDLAHFQATDNGIAEADYA